MTNEEKEKIDKVEKRLKEVESLLAYHYHGPLGCPYVGNGRTIWFKSMGPYQK